MLFIKAGHAGQVHTGQNTDFSSFVRQIINGFLDCIEIAVTCDTVAHGKRAATVTVGQRMKFSAAIMNHFSDCGIFTSICPLDNCQRSKKTPDSMMGNPFFKLPWNYLVGSFGPCCNNPEVAGDPVGPGEGDL